MGILTKIWLSLSILIAGYFISMALGFVSGRQTESRLYNVSEYLFPAATQSQLSLTAFDEQIKLYKDAVLVGDESFLELALAKSKEAQNALVIISKLKGLDRERINSVNGCVEKLKDFTKEAQTVYRLTEFLSNSTEEGKDEGENLFDSKAIILADQTNQLRGKLTYFAEEFAKELKTELSAISNNTKQQRYLNMVVFFTVVVSALIMVSVIVNRTISRPLRKTLMLEKAVEQSVDGIAVTDLNGKLQFINHAWAFMHGYEISELIEKNVGVFHTEEQFKNEINPFNQIVIKNGSHAGEVWHKRKDGTVFPVFRTGNLLTGHDKKTDSMVCHARDITERKDVEKALKESLDNLTNAQTQLVQSEKFAALGGLVAGVAHEINTPLGVGITAASFLDEKTQTCEKQFASGKLENDELKKYMKTASESSSMILSNLFRAADLVRSFKLVAVDQSSMEHRRFNMKEYIDEVLFSLRPQYKRTRHTITVNCPSDIVLNSYPGAFFQIITNLVTNSMIHGFEGNEGGEIEFNIWKDKDELTFCYSDNGKGMDQETLDKSFDPFFTTNRSHGGKGLGLHILYNLVSQTLKGQIEHTSTQDKGVVCHIRVPLNIIEDDGNEQNKSLRV